MCGNASSPGSTGQLLNIAISNASGDTVKMRQWIESEHKKSS
jgi:hypothetical protein